MARNSGNRQVIGPELTVGVRGAVRRSTEADVTGAIIEDYAALTDCGGRGTSGHRCIGGRSCSTMGDWSSPTPKT
ncbi:hypothetical protein L1080_036775 [Rhodococcus sp. MSC1_016]|jgi:hypothetical protein|uniref:hypothetical protein n=1 Tax=Rhodococcus sp. MSC1_016 TaxID=2909266 RepID=UPI00202F32FF